MKAKLITILIASTFVVSGVFAATSTGSTTNVKTVAIPSKPTFVAGPGKLPIVGTGTNQTQYFSGTVSYSTGTSVNTSTGVVKTNTLSDVLIKIGTSNKVAFKGKNGKFIAFIGKRISVLESDKQIQMFKDFNTFLHSQSQVKFTKAGLVKTSLLEDMQLITDKLESGEKIDDSFVTNFINSLNEDNTFQDFSNVPGTTTSTSSNQATSGQNTSTQYSGIDG